MKRQAVLKNLKKIWVGSLCASALFICDGYTHSRAQDSVPLGLQTLSYNVYAGGINAVNGKMEIDTSRAGEYGVKYSAKTRGFLAKLAPWSGSFETQGWRVSQSTPQNEMAAAKYLPRVHKSVSTWKEDKEVKEYHYNQDGSFESFIVTNHAKTPSKKTVDPALTNNTIDTLTMTMRMFEKVASGGKCEGEDSIFDGKRRFKMKFVDRGAVELKSSRYNIYEGSARECTIEVTPNGGKWHEKPRGWLSIQEQGREKGTMPTLWVAQLKDGHPAVPVKVRVKTDYGTLFMHLTKAK